MAAFLTYHWEIAGGGSVAQARTTAINVFVCVQIAYLFNCRSLGRPLVTAHLPGNRMLAVGIASTLALQLLITYLPAMNTLFDTALIDVNAWLSALGAGVTAFVLVELDKLVWRWAQHGRGRSAGQEHR